MAKAAKKTSKGGTNKTVVSKQSRFKEVDAQLKEIAALFRKVKPSKKG